MRGSGVQVPPAAPHAATTLASWTGDRLIGDRIKNLHAPSCPKLELASMVGSSEGRLKICYVVPGHDLVSTVGPTRNVLSLARALSDWADVTVAFRRATEPEQAHGLGLLEIDPDAPLVLNAVDDASTRGMSPLQFLKFIWRLRNFVTSQLREFDVVLEKSWMLSGLVCNICQQRGQSAIAIENYVPNARHAAGSSFAKLMRIRCADWLTGKFLRKARLIIAETSNLKSGISSHWRVPEDRIKVVSLGVDRSLFHDRDQTEARAELDLATSATIILYVGTLDATHNLEPFLEALATVDLLDTEVHIVGDGQKRADYETLARQSRCTVRFHGRVDHHFVPIYISAADICLAPYDATAFQNSELGYATMKIPEYLSVGRPVVAAPSSRARELISHDHNGFIFENSVGQWCKFLSSIPSRTRLAEMAAATKNAPLMSWQDTARQYLSLCTHVNEKQPAPFK